MKKLPFGKMLCLATGGAYSLAVTTRKIRLHLDKVQAAFCTCHTEPFLSST